MALVNTTEMFKKAYDGGYAIGIATEPFLDDGGVGGAFEGLRVCGYVFFLARITRFFFSLCFRSLRLIR